MADASAPSRGGRSKRRRYVVDRRFQLKFTAFVVVSAGIFAVTVMAEYYGYFGRSVSSNLLDPGLLFLFLAANKLLLIKLVLFLGVFLAVSVLLSFRIAGPLFNLQRSFRAVAEGALFHRARFRQKDELHEVAEEFNRMMETLQKKVEGDRGTAEEMIEALEAFSRAGLDAGQLKSLEELREKARRLTQGFRL